MTEDNKLQKQTSDKKNSKSNDWMAVVITIFLLGAIVADSSKGMNQKAVADSTLKNNIGVVDSTAFNQDTQRIEHGISMFDTTFYILKRSFEKSR